MTRTILFVQKPTGSRKELFDFGTRVSYKHISSKDEAWPHQSGRKDASENHHGCVLRAWRGWREPIILGYSRQAVQAPGSRTIAKFGMSMCRRNSQTLRSTSTFTRRNARQGGTLSKITKKKRTTMKQPLSIPLKYVDGMRQTRTRTDNASEHTLNEY